MLMFNQTIDISENARAALPVWTFHLILQRPLQRASGFQTYGSSKQHSVLFLCPVALIWSGCSCIHTTTRLHLYHQKNPTQTPCSIFMFFNKLNLFFFCLFFLVEPALLTKSAFSFAENQNHWNGIKSNYTKKKDWTFLLMYTLIGCYQVTVSRDEKKWMSSRNEQKFSFVQISSP